MVMHLRLFDIFREVAWQFLLFSDLLHQSLLVEAFYEALQKNGLIVSSETRIPSVLICKL